MGQPHRIRALGELLDHLLSQGGVWPATGSEIVDAWRMSGDVDYVLHVVVSDIAAYDGFYRKLIAALPLRNVSSRFSMERMKAAPLPV